MTDKSRTDEPSHDDEAAGRYAYEGLERAIHEKARLGILTSLATHPEGLVFTELRDLCGLTDGNLNRHVKVLQDEQLVEVWKGFRGKRPQTLVRMTEAGRTRFRSYLDELERVLTDAAAASAPEKSSPGWNPA